MGDVRNALIIGAASGGGLVSPPRAGGGALPRACPHLHPHRDEVRISLSDARLQGVDRATRVILRGVAPARFRVVFPWWLGFVARAACCCRTSIKAAFANSAKLPVRCWRVGYRHRLMSVMRRLAR